MAAAFVRCGENVFESARLRLGRPKSIRTVHRMYKDRREQRIAVAVEGTRDRAPHTRLDGGDEPERRPSFPGAALVHEFAGQVGIARERCRQHHVTGSSEGLNMLCARGLAIDRYDISDSERRQDALLQELTEFSASANDQYGVAILRFAGLT